MTTSTFPLRDNDGMPRFVYDLAKALAQRCRVTVLAPHHPGARRQESFGNLTIKRFQYSWPAASQRLAYGYGMRDNLRQSWMAKAQVPVYIASLCFAVGKLLRKERFDVINSHWMVPQGLAVSLALKGFPEIAHVVTAHAADVFLLERMKAGKPVARYVASRTDMFLPVGSHVASSLTEMVGTQKPLAIQPMGVDRAVFSASPNRALSQPPFNGNFLLFIGRLVEKKGLTYLLDALKLLFCRGFDVGLVVIGSGTLKARMKAKAFQLGIQDRVLFMGTMGHESILPYLQSCKVVVIPSILDPSRETEGMPTVLAEALSFGCKVVAGKAGGIPDVLIDGCNGWLARPADAWDLADKLITALGHTDGNIENNARQSVRDLDWGCIAKRYGDFFRDAIEYRQHRKARVQAMAPVDAVKAMIVSNSLNQGGAERFASRLTSGLNRDRVAPSLVLLRGDITYALADDVRVGVLGYRHPLDLFKAIVRLRRILRIERPDVILGTGTSVNVVIGCALTGMKRRPAWIARVDIDRGDLWLRKGVLGLLYPLADAIVANSSGLQRAVERFYPRQQRKIMSILNPVDFEQIDHMAGRTPPWKQRTRVPLLISVGRAHPSKRWDLLLEIFSKLIQTTPAELVLCGGGPMLAQLKKKAFKLKIDTLVHFLGHCNNPFSILARADLFLLNSEAEGLPNALIEAQGLGLCAVSTNCDFGPNEIIEHGQTGLLVDVHDQAQFINSVAQLLADESLRERMGAKARQVVRKRFDFKMRCRQWEQLLIKAARHRCGMRPRP